MSRFFTIVSFLVLSYASAQLDVPFNQVSNGLSFYNPSFVAQSENSEVLVGVKLFKTTTNTVDVGGTSVSVSKATPQIAYLSGNVIVKEGNNKSHGLGAYIRQYAYSPFSKLNFGLNYGLNIQLNKKTAIGMGTAFKLISNRIDFDELYFLSSEPLLATNTGRASSITVESNIGGYLKKSKYEVGLSFLNLLGSKAFSNSFDPFGLADNVGVYNPDRLHIYFKYEIGFDSSGWRLLPQLQSIMTNDFRLINTLGLSAENKLLGVGLSYRHLSGVALLASVKAKGFKLSYSYEFLTTDLRTYSGYLSHEIFISYSLSKKKE